MERTDEKGRSKASEQLGILAMREKSGLRTILMEIIFPLESGDHPACSY